MEFSSVINFWFKEIEPAKWWVKDTAFDQVIINRFKELHHQAVQGELAHWRSCAQGRLAEIIVLDQFSRNMYRDKAEAFSSDSIALVLAQEAISLGLDKQLSAIERSFLYMPYMHSESRLIHQDAVKLYQVNGLENNLDFELKHKVIIDKFGRYPHRNAILNRQSSEEEINFLQQPNSSF